MSVNVRKVLINYQMGTMTLSIMALSIMTFNIMTLIKPKLSMMSGHTE